MEKAKKEIINNKVKVESMTLTASLDDLRASKCVVKKIGFNDAESQAITDAGIDTDALEQAKADADIKAAQKQAITFFKVDAKGVNNGAIVAIIDANNKLHVNGNCDFSNFGAGGIATRLRLSALYNAFLDIFKVADVEPAMYNGVTIKCEKSLVDARRDGKAVDADAVAW